MSACSELCVCRTPLGRPGGSRGAHDHPDVGGVRAGSATTASGANSATRRVWPARGRRRPPEVGSGKVGDHPVPGVSRPRKLAGHEDDPGIDVVEDETSSWSRRRQDRVDGHPGQGGAEVDDGGLVPVGQHQRDHALPGHPATAVSGRHGWPFPAGSRHRAGCRRR